MGCFAPTYLMGSASKILTLCFIGLEIDIRMLTKNKFNLNFKKLIKITVNFQWQDSLLPIFLAHVDLFPIVGR